MAHELSYDAVNGLDALDETRAEFVMDEEAFRGFYDRNARSIWAYLSRVTGDRQTADDLLQETFYRFLRAAAKHEDEAHRRNSLYRIATNLARDEQRRNRIRKCVSEEAAVDRLPAVGVAGEALTDLSRAMSHLKPREKEMLWLAYAEGATHDEVAAAMGLRPASMKALLFRARRKLAALMRALPRGAGE